MVNCGGSRGWRDRERESVSVCVREREGERERGRVRARESRLFFLETDKAVRFVMQVSILKL